MSNRYFWPRKHLDFAEALYGKKVSLEGKLYSMNESDLRRFAFRAVEALSFYLAAEGYLIMEDDGLKALEALLPLTDIKGGK